MAESTQLLFRWREALCTAAELTSSDRHIAHVVGFNMDADGRDGWPAIKTIVERTALAKSTVLDSLEWLAVSGWLIPHSRGRRTSKLYTPAIPPERKTRADRSAWANERRQRLRNLRASRSESSPTERVGIVTHSEPTADIASRSESLPRVGRNGDAESVGIADHYLFQTSPTDHTHNPPTEALSVAVAEPTTIEIQNEHQQVRAGDGRRGGEAVTPAHFDPDEIAALEFGEDEPSNVIPIRQGGLEVNGRKIDARELVAQLSTR